MVDQPVRCADCRREMTDREWRSVFGPITVGVPRCRVRWSCGCAGPFVLVVEPEPDAVPA